MAVASWLGSTVRHAGLVLEHRFDLDMLAERRSQQLGGVDDQHVDVDLARLQRLLAGEREQMLGEIRAARGGVVDHPGDRRELRLLLDRVRQDLDGAGDDRQDIVEIMRDAAGELTEGFHLFGLPDAVLRRDLVGQIAEHQLSRGTRGAAAR